MGAKTDKSGKMCLDTVDNYINGMKEHVKDDVIVTSKQLRKSE